MNARPVRHFDEAHQNSLQIIEQLLQDNAAIQRAVFTPDIFARIRVILWYAQDAPSPEQTQALQARFASAAGPFWGQLWIASPQASSADLEMFDSLWEEATPFDATDRIRINERHRSLSVWLRQPPDQPWPADRPPAAGPPVISFYAFKGGSGRSTALAIFAAQRAQAGERVVAIDLDLAAPGIGVLLGDPAAAPAGVVDYWVEQPLVGEALDLRDYYYPVTNPALLGPGSIFVFPAGRFNQHYPTKLARLDFTPPTHGRHPLETLLYQIRDELQPDWILLDARAGISEAAGFALGGLAHLNVLFGGTSEAVWQGLRLAVHRLGAERISHGLPQEECLLVQSMVVDFPEMAELATREFLRRAEAVFEQEYYLADPDSPDDPDEGKFWYIQDKASSDAPHVPVALYYSPRLAFFTQIEHAVEYGLKADDYQELGKRITDRFPRIIL